MEDSLITMFNGDVSGSMCDDHHNKSRQNEPIESQIASHSIIDK